MFHHYICNLDYDPQDTDLAYSRYQVGARRNIISAKDDILTIRFDGIEWILQLLINGQVIGNPMIVNHKCAYYPFISRQFNDTDCKYQLVSYNDTKY